MGWRKRDTHLLPAQTAASSFHLPVLPGVKSVLPRAVPSRQHAAGKQRKLMGGKMYMGRGCPLIFLPNTDRREIAGRENKRVKANPAVTPDIN